MADTVKSAKQIARRCVILYAVTAVGFGEDRKKVTEWLHKEGLWKYTSPLEQALLTSKRPSKQQLINASWMVEALAPLTWAIGATSKPELAYEVNLSDIIGKLPRLFTSTTDFIKNAALRPEDELQLEHDAVDHAHWRIRDARLNKKPLPTDLACEAIPERHRAMNWLIGFDKSAWDDISTDT
jgi:hypothetical protein